MLSYCDHKAYKHESCFGQWDVSGSSEWKLLRVIAVSHLCAYLFPPSRQWHVPNREDGPSAYVPEWEVTWIRSSATHRCWQVMWVRSKVRFRFVMTLSWRSKSSLLQCLFSDRGSSQIEVVWHPSPHAFNPTSSNRKQFKFNILKRTNLRLLGKVFE